MANVLGCADLTAATNTTVYTNSSGASQAVSVNVCNRNATSAYIRLAIAAAGTPAASEYIEYDVELFGNESFERSGLVMANGALLVAYSDVASVSVQVYGV